MSLHRGVVEDEKFIISQLIGSNFYKLTLLALSTSPQGNLLLNAIPVNGVPVGGNSIDASIVRYSTFRGRF